MRILTMLGVLLAVLAAVFHFAAIAGTALMLLLIAAVICIGVGALTGN